MAPKGLDLLVAGFMGTALPLHGDRVFCATKRYVLADDVRENYEAIKAVLQVQTRPTLGVLIKAMTLAAAMQPAAAVLAWPPIELQAHGLLRLLAKVRRRLNCPNAGCQTIRTTTGKPNNQQPAARSTDSQRTLDQTASRMLRRHGAQGGGL